MKQAFDFLDESRCLFSVVADMNEDQLSKPTLFKEWTTLDIIGHLHMFNYAAGLAIENAQLFRDFFAPMAADLTTGKSLLRVQNEWLAGVGGPALIKAWKSEYEKISDIFAAIDPKQRVAWAGPDMSARSSITARQMETWAHGQAIFDLLGITREEGERIKNIAHMGVNTFGWSFSNRKMPVPEQAPVLKLLSPKGEEWIWNGENVKAGSITGSAVEFCQVVTQTRNIGDTALVCEGETARQWMAIAQCFAGPPVDGPKVGERHCA